MYIHARVLCLFRLYFDMSYLCSFSVVLAKWAFISWYSNEGKENGKERTLHKYIPYYSGRGGDNFGGFAADDQVQKFEHWNSSH